jgi:hypothetical protein
MVSIQTGKFRTAVNQVRRIPHLNTVVSGGRADQKKNLNSVEACAYMYSSSMLSEETTVVVVCKNI